MITQTPPLSPVDLAEKIEKLLSSNKFAEARELLESQLTKKPDDLIAKHALGVTLAQLGQPEDAAKLLDSVIKAQPKNTAAHVDYGNVCRELGRHDEAVRFYRTAISISPNFAEAHYNLAITLRDVGELTQATQALQRTIMFKPQHALAYCTLGQMCADSDPEAAGSYFRQALAAERNMLAAQTGLMISLAQLGRFDEAERVLGKAMKAHPGNLLVLRQKALIEIMQGKLAEAEETYRQILQQSPDAEDARLNLGSVYQAQGDNSRAQALLEQALHDADAKGSKQRNPNLLNALANLRVIENDLEAAETLMQEAAAAAPQSAPLSASLGRVLLARGDIAGAIAQYEKAVLLAPHIPELYSNLIYALHLDNRLSPEERFSKQKDWDFRFSEGKQKTRETYNPNPDRKLRVGFISGDFREHPVSRGLIPLLENYNRDNLETFAYSTSYAEDDVTAHIKANVDHWRPSAALLPATLNAKIARDGIDILIDLAGHTAGNRLVVFARRAAPVQATWLGFFASTGIAAMDYRLSDAVMDPADQTSSFHSESLLHLPAPFCYRPNPQAPEVSALPALQNGHITFGAMTGFNRFNKEVLETWAPIFRALPTARLKVFSGCAARDTTSLDIISQKLQAIGLDPARVDILPWLEYSEYLSAVRGVDVALDPFPYPGGMTTIDALWMGVPTITLAGRSSFERAGASLLTIAGLPELITASKEQYIQTAIDIAGKTEWLATVRANLRDTLSKTPLIDGQAFAKSFESALRTAWINFLESK